MQIGIVFELFGANAERRIRHSPTACDHVGDRVTKEFYGSLNTRKARVVA